MFVTIFVGNDSLKNIGGFKMTILIIAEKPDMGRKIAEALGGLTKKSGYFESNQYIVTYAVGHLLGLAEPDHYDDRYKRWNLEDLPIVPDKFQLIPSTKTKDQLKLIHTLSKQCSSIVNACDAGREGELIAGYILQYLNIKKPVQRLWISSLTPEAIREGFKNLKNGEEYYPLLTAARCRSEADWLIGMNATRAFTTKFGGPGNVLSVGRVQTPVLAMICDRQDELERFKPQTSYTVEANFQQENTSYTGLWHTEEDVVDRTVADRVSNKVKGKVGRIESYEVKDGAEKPPLLYDLGDLQSDANRMFGFSAKKTLQIAQSLYEDHEIIHYPRTSSNFVAADNIPVMHKVFNLLRSLDKYQTLIFAGDTNLVSSSNKNICRPEKVEDHHAIFPTQKLPGNLNIDEEKLYDLIVRRFIVHFYPSANYRHHRINTVIENEQFKTSIRETMDEGWKVVYKTLKNENKNKDTENTENSEEMNEISNFNFDPEQMSFCISSNTKERVTKAPPAYTEGTLIKAMKHVGRKISDTQLKEGMTDLQLGTPATRDSVIEKLKDQSYIELKGRKISPTSKGRELVSKLRELELAVLTSAEMTAMWEKRLNEIAKGQAAHDKFMHNVIQFTNKIVQKIKDQQTDVANRIKNDFGDCPICKAGKIIEGTRGFGCSLYNEGCKFTIWKVQYGKTISHKHVNDLISKGKTETIKFKNKSKVEYKAKLILMNAEIKLEFVNSRKLKK